METGKQGWLATENFALRRNTTWGKRCGDTCHEISDGTGDDCDILDVCDSDESKAIYRMKYSLDSGF